MVISRRCFAEDGKENNVPKLKRHVQSYYFLTFSLALSLSLLKVPNHTRHHHHQHHHHHRHYCQRHPHHRISGNEHYTWKIIYRNVFENRTPEEQATAEATMPLQIKFTTARYFQLSSIYQLWKQFVVSFSTVPSFSDILVSSSQNRHRSGCRPCLLWLSVVPLVCTANLAWPSGIQQKRYYKNDVTLNFRRSNSLGRI